MDLAINEVHFFLLQPEFASVFENPTDEHEFIAAAVADVQRFVSTSLVIEGEAQALAFPDPKKIHPDFFREVKEFLYSTLTMFCIQWNDCLHQLQHPHDK